MLPIERQVPGELIHQQPRDEADIRSALLQNPGRRRQGEDLRAALELDHRPPILQDLVGPRALRDPVSHLLADDLVLIRWVPLDVLVHQSDGADRNSRLVEELQFLAALGAVALNRASGMRGDTLAFLDALGRDREGLAQMQLRGVRLWREALALLAKDLATEPLELVCVSEAIRSSCTAMVCACERTMETSSAA